MRAYTFDAPSPKLTTFPDGLTRLHKYWPDGSLRSVMWAKEGHGLHREHGPAELLYQENGWLWKKVWWWYGKIHRPNNKPAELTRVRPGNKLKVSLGFYVNDMLHRTDGAASEYFENGMKCGAGEWCLEGRTLPPFGLFLNTSIETQWEAVQHYAADQKNRAHVLSLLVKYVIKDRKLKEAVQCFVPML